MKTIKFSLNVLLVVGGLLFSMVSCQDDTVEDGLVSTDPTNDAVAQHSVPDDIQQLLNTVLDDAPSGNALTSARTASENAFVYDLSIIVSEFMPSDPDAGVVDQLTGQLTLQLVDSIPGTNVIIGGDQEFQLYSGFYEFAGADGETLRRAASAIVLDDGFDGLSIRDLPGAGTLNVGSAFVLGASFSVEQALSRTAEQPSELLSSALEATFLGFQEPGSIFYDLAVTLSELERVPGEGFVAGETLQQLEGVLALQPEEEERLFAAVRQPYSGTYTFVDEEGVTRERAAEAVILQGASGGADITLSIEDIISISINPDNTGNQARIFSDSFVIGANFSDSLANAGGVFTTFQGAFTGFVASDSIPEEAPETPTTTELSYDFSVTALVSGDTIDQLNGLLRVEFDEFGRIVGGAYTYTTADGSTGTSGELFGIVFPDNPQDSFIEIPDLAASPVDFIGVSNLPLGQATFTFSAGGAGRTNAGNTINAIFEGTLVENPS